MRKLVLLILILLSPTVYASRPITEDEVLACVNGGTPAKAAPRHACANDNSQIVGDIQSNIKGEWFDHPEDRLQLQ